MQFLFGLLTGALIGLITIVIKRMCRKPIGDLRVDRSDIYDSPLLFLELDNGVNINTIIGRKQVSFRVKPKDFIPHK